MPLLPQSDLLLEAVEQMEVVRFRQKTFRLPGISDCCWVMLLELFRARCNGAKLSVTSLCYMSGMPVTTAIRRIDELEKHRIAIRVKDASDKRRFLVELTDEAFGEIERYLVAAKFRKRAAPAALSRAGVR